MVGERQAQVRHASLVVNGNVVPRGLEPRTLRLLAVRSNQLSYETLATSAFHLYLETQFRMVKECDCHVKDEHKPNQTQINSWTNECEPPHEPSICWCRLLKTTQHGAEAGICSCGLMDKAPPS